MTSGLNSVSFCKFWSIFCPQTDNPFILLLCEMSFLWLQNIITKYRGQKLKKDIFKRFWNNFDFVPPMIYDTKAIIWQILFIANIFEWTKNPSVLEVPVWPEDSWFYGCHWRVKEKLIFPFNELLDREQVCIFLRLPS